MGFASEYLGKHSFYKPFIMDAPQSGVSMIVVIPCFNETGIIDSLVSLFKAHRPSFPLELIVVVNSPEGSCSTITEQNKKTVVQVQQWSAVHYDPGFRVHVIDVPPFPAKHAGAGFARKTGMDEAVHRFNLLNNKQGIIVSFDSDSLCDSNYFTELEKCFSRPGIRGCTIYFEHLFGDDNSSQTGNPAIAEYELFLRYYVQAMRWAGFPYAFHTIGSCFAVNSGTYAAQGGMNRKTAGEDFYFLHKIFPLGGVTELNTTRVIPSSRISDRVPFGTGATMKRLAGKKQRELYTYPLVSFRDLSELFSRMPEFFKCDKKGMTKIIGQLPCTLESYLRKNDFVKAAEQMNKHSTGLHTFRKRFYVWFNALRLLQFLNFARYNYNDLPVSQAASSLLEKIDIPVLPGNSGLLQSYREMQRQTVWDI